MGWAHPGIPLEDLMNLIKGFVDILILTSGFQSSGRDVHWSPTNITRAFQWSRFFEDVLRNLSHLDCYEESVKALDGALLEMKSSDSFPLGLKHLSSATLSKARGFLVEHFIDSLPLKDSHLRAFLTAVIEMDLIELSGTDRDRLRLYLDELKVQKTLTSLVQHRGLSIDNSNESLKESWFANAEEFGGESLTKYTVQKLTKRWCAVSDVSKYEKSLTAVSEKIKISVWSEFDDKLFKEQLEQSDPAVVVEQLVGFVTWNRWKSKSLCYFLDKRAVRMVSGASMIFSAPKIQWVQVLRRLNNPTAISEGDLRDTVELLLFGCITSRWSNLIEHLMSVSYNPITTLEQYDELCKLLQGRSTIIESKDETISSQECDILEYMTVLLGGQLHPLWNISPVLAASAIPCCSPLFKFYLSELETQIRGDYSKMRCCSCDEEKKEHNESDLAERIWCVYIFHVYGAAGHTRSQ